MYKGKQPAPKNPSTKSYNSETTLGKKSTTLSKDRLAPKFSSFNNIIQTNQSVDMNNSRRLSNNPSPGNSMVLSGVAGNGSNSKMSRKQFTNSYAAQFQDKQNKSKNSREDSLNMSKRLPTNTSVNNYNSNKSITEEYDHANCAHTASKANPNEKNCNLMSIKSSKNVNSNIRKPPKDSSSNINNNYNSNNKQNSNKKIVNINLDMNNNNNINNNVSYNENMQQQQLQNLRRESVENKNNFQNNFTFNDNIPNSNLKESSSNLNQNTNGNALAGQGNTNNNPNIHVSNHDSSNTNSNVYVNSKNSKEKTEQEGNRNTAQSASQKQTVYKNNSSTKIVNANLANNKAEQIKKFASDIAKSKGKNNIYDLIKTTTGKKPTANSTDSQTNTSKNNLTTKNNNNTINNSINSSSNNNKNNKLLGSTEINRVSIDRENSLLGSNLNNLQNLDNLNQRNSKTLNTSNLINVATSNNFSSSPVNPIKNDQHPFNSLNGSIGFSSVELVKSPQKDEEENKIDQKSPEKTTAAFNKYRNDNKQKNALNKRNSAEMNINEIDNFSTNKNLKDINNNNNKEHVPQEDDFNFNYNDERIYLENQENSKKEIVEDDLDNFDKPKGIAESENFNNNINTNTNNKYNHIRKISNNYLSHEPLTSIEEIDEKHNLLNTEENGKSNKDANSNAGWNVNQKEENNEQPNKVDLLSKNKFNINSNPHLNSNKGVYEKKLPSLESPINLNNAGASPTRKTYKNEADDQEIQKTFGTNVGMNPGGSENKISNSESKKPNNSQRGFNYKEDINSGNKDFNSIQNMTNNISPINNDGDPELKKKNPNEVDLNLTPINQIKDQNDVYKRGRVTRKSNDFADLIMLNNLIEEKFDIPKPSEALKPEKAKASQPTQSATSDVLTKTNFLKKPETNGNIGSQALAKSNTLRENTEKKLNSTTNLKEKSPNTNSSANNQNKSFNKSVTINPNTSQNLKGKETINNTSTIKQAKEIQNSTLNNKEENSLLNELVGAGAAGVENSKILNTNASVKNVKTGGNELNSSKTFNKLLSTKENAAAAIAAAKSLSTQKTLGSGKKAFESKKSVVAPSGRSSIRKSLSINPNNQSAFKNNLNRTGLGNMTMNASTVDTKKKTNFISKSKLQFSKPNQSDFQSTKLSRQSILGKIMSTRNVKGDDRSKNILTDLDKESFDASATEANQQKRPLNQFNSTSRMSVSSFRDSYDFDFDRKFSGTLRSDDCTTLKRRNTKSFPDKFYKRNLYKKNSMIISPENQIDFQSKSFHSITGSGLCENLKIRINEFHVLNRTKLKPKTKKAAKFNKGKYELIESFDASFGLKHNYHPNELCVSPSAFIALNEKEEAKEILVKPPNFRKEQKDEINQKLFEKLQGNFIDESITKITKMSRLERMRNNRYSSISVSPTRVMNNFCFSPLPGGADGKKDGNCLGSTQNLRAKAHKDSDAEILSPGVCSDRTLKYSSINDESINLNNNFVNAENPVVKAQKKIGNSKVLLMENNFMICSGDEEKVFSPFDSYIEGNNNNNASNNLLMSPGLHYNVPAGAGHAEITYQNKQKLEKLDRLEKISNTALNISRTNLKQDKSNFNTLNANNKNNNDSEVVVESAAFTIAHFDNVQNPNDNKNEMLKSPNWRMKRIKALEPQNVINLFYQMHPEKNKFGFYSFTNKDEELTSNAFSLLKSSAPNNNKNPNLNMNQLNKSLNNSLHISNPVNETINVTRISNPSNIHRSNFQKLEINNNNFELEQNQHASNTTKNVDKYQNSNLKKITFNLTANPNDNNNENDNNNNNNLNPLSGLGSAESSKTNSNTKNNLADEGYSLTFAGNNNQNNLNNNLRDAFKNANTKLNLVAEAISNSNNSNPAVQKALLETKNTLAENIRKHKENFNDVDFFDKVKNFLEAKRIQTHALEQAYLNTDSSVNKTLRNRATLSKIDALNRSAEKANISINNINKSVISNVNNNNKTHSYNPNNLVVVSSGNRNFPFSSNNNQSTLNNENKNITNNNNHEPPKAPENRTKSLKDALHRLNDLDSLDNQADSTKLVLPMNTRTKAPLRESTETNENNNLNEANIELLSEKLKKEKQMELLNQRFQEKLMAMKNSKNNNNFNNANNIIENFHDFEFENFKNEFKRNNIHNGFSSKEKTLNENLNTFANLNNSKLAEQRASKKDEILISDEQLSEFKDKFLGKSEFIDKDNVKLFYKKYLKGVNASNAMSNNKRENNEFNNGKKLKNFFLVDKEEKSAQSTDAAKKEKELSLRLEKLKNMLKIDDPKKAKELKNQNSQNFLYEKAVRKNEAEIILNNLNSSNITNLLNLNESKINNANYNSAGSNNNTLKLLGGLSTLKFGSNFGNSLGSNFTNNAFGNSNNALNNRDDGENKEKVLPINQLNVGSGVNTSKNALVRDLKFNF